MRQFAQPIEEKQEILQILNVNKLLKKPIPSVWQGSNVIVYGTEIPAWTSGSTEIYFFSTGELFNHLQELGVSVFYSSLFVFCLVFSSEADHKSGETL